MSQEDDEWESGEDAARWPHMRWRNNDEFLEWWREVIGEARRTGRLPARRDYRPQ